MWGRGGRGRGRGGGEGKGTCGGERGGEGQGEGWAHLGLNHCWSHGSHCFNYFKYIELL